MAERKPQSYQRVPQLIDINLLPEEYRRRPLSDLGRLLIVFVIVLVVLLYPLNVWRWEGQADVIGLKKELLTLQKETKRLSDFETQVKELKAATETTQKKVEGLNRDIKALEGRSVRCARVLRELDQQATAKGIVFTSITQQTSSLVVKGDATSYAALLDFVATLRASGLFSRISFQQAEGKVAGVSFALVFDIKTGVVK